MICFVVFEELRLAEKLHFLLISLHYIFCVLFHKMCISFNHIINIKPHEALVCSDCIAMMLCIATNHASYYYKIPVNQGFLGLVASIHLYIKSAYMTINCCLIFSTHLEGAKPIHKFYMSASSYLCGEQSGIGSRRAQRSPRGWWS